jgi:death on curing protein
LEPVFLRLSEILEIHRDQIERYGGAPGLRDLNLLISAAATPAVSFRGQYLHDDLCAMAAAYLFHIVRNHPFVDGNKRTGAVTALVFLALNNVETAMSEEELETMVRAVAEGRMSKAEVTLFLRRYAHPDN